MPSGAELVVSVGRYVKEKNHELLLESLALLSRRRRRLRALIVGKGPLEADLIAKARALGLGGIVTLTGERTDAIDITAACDVFALSSMWEGLPLALLEAMTLGDQSSLRRSGASVTFCGTNARPSSSPRGRRTRSQAPSIGFSGTLNSQHNWARTRASSSGRRRPRKPWWSATAPSTSRRGGSSIAPGRWCRYAARIGIRLSTATRPGPLAMTRSVYAAGLACLGRKLELQRARARLRASTARSRATHRCDRAGSPALSRRAKG